MKTKQLRIDGAIESFWSDNGAKMVAQNIQLAELESGDCLEITINSPGGAVFEALGIIGAINKAKSEGIIVVAKIEGCAASAASLVACACSEVVMSVGALMMIHNVQGCSQGDQNQLRADADLIEKMGNAISAVYVAKTGKTKDEILALMNAETWMDGTEAVALGFADRVDESFAMVACASLGMAGYAIPDRFKNQVEEPATEPVVEPAPEPVVDPVPEPTPEPVIEPVLENVVAEEIPQPVPTPEPVANPDDIRRDAIIEERARVEAITNMAPANIDVSALIKDGTSVADAPALILAMVNAAKPTEAMDLLDKFRNGGSLPNAFSTENSGASQIVAQYKKIEDSKERAIFFAQNREVILSFNK